MKKACDKIDLTNFSIQFCLFVRIQSLNIVSIIKLNASVHYCLPIQAKTKLFILGVHYKIEPGWNFQRLYWILRKNKREIISDFKKSLKVIRRLQGFNQGSNSASVYMLSEKKEELPILNGFIELCRYRAKVSSLRIKIISSS